MQNKFYLLGYIALFFLSGCTGLPLNSNDYPVPKEISKGTKEYNDMIKKHEKEIKNHVIAIGRDGDLRSPLTGKEMPSSQYEDDYFINIVENIKEYVRKKTGGAPELLIYIHGGLNSEGGALQRALNNYQLIKNSGKYPIFINWRSGPATTYLAHLWRIRQGEKSDTALMTSPVYLATDVGKSIINAPKAWLVSGEHLIRSLNKDKITTDLDSQIKFHNDSHPDLVTLTEGKGRSNFFRHLQWAATSPFKIVTTPFTYTMSKPAWDIMLRRTNTLFYTPCDLKKTPKDSHCDISPEMEGNEKSSAGIELKSGNGALYRFLSALEQDDEASKVKITLIGHSMGAIVVNDIINLGLNLTYKNIVHMASADSIENFLNKVVPYIDCSLEKNKESACNNGVPVKFYSLYLHPDNENREVSAEGFTPSGSLLTWIDGMFTIPKTVLDKRSGRWDNMTRAIELIPPVGERSEKQNDIKEQMSFTIFNTEERKAYSPDGLSKLGINIAPQDYGKNGKVKCLYSTAQKHGDFGDLPFWLQEVWEGSHPTAQGVCK
ncbi:MAG: hypothetical protein Q3M24_07230 [Candidatus Electrothrix aestuarii]|uniref:Alpha/beta hydrolase n=1 Tax=Candidatus Electrothrix aestuarii TaxID=3062594 RepID=A0AAU8LZ75_9BACT|nr:hypothetical protein [Candidatus Electrothrix aestuarii]